MLGRVTFDETALERSCTGDISEVDLFTKPQWRSFQSLNVQKVL